MLGWLVVIDWAGLMAGRAASAVRMAGRFPFLPDTWWPGPEVHLVFIWMAKLMVLGLTMAWTGVLLYRHRLRRA